ncbi:hypothetical protein ACWDR7_00340 [Microbacterium sp. NPDC003461]
MSDQNRGDQNRDEQPASIPTPEPVVDSPFDAIPPAAPGSVPPPAAPRAPGSGDHATPPVVPPAAAASHANPGGYPGHPGAAPGAPSPAPAQPPYSGTPQPYPGSGPAQPGGYPGAYPAPGYPGQPYGSAPVPPAGRPRQVTTACILAWVIAGLGLFSVVAALLLLVQYPGIDGAFLFGALVIPVLVIIGLAVFAFFTWQGKGWARIALTVVFALNAISALSNIGNGQPQSLLGLVLSVGSIVLLWLPASNAWFRAKRSAA